MAPRLLSRVCLFLSSAVLWVAAAETAPAADIILPSFATGSYAGLDETDLQRSTSFTITNATQYAAYCWYPVSGTYGRLPRILFYLIVLFALLARTHEWLIAGALAAAFIYSGAAAVHACLLVWIGPGMGELDMIGLLAILSTSCLVIVPLLSWSSTIRNLGKKPGSEGDVTRSLITYWGFLMTVGFICIFAAFKGYTASDFGFINAGGVDTIACAPPNGIFDLSAGQKVEFGGLVFTQEFIDANNCANPCSVPFAGRGALFRSNDDLTTLRVKDMEDMWNGPALSEKRQEMNIFAFGYLNYALWLLPYILAQGICAACFPRKSPSQVRDFLYLYFRDGRWGRPGGRRHMVWARLIATGAYLWAVLMLVLCPPLFVINLIAIEFVINPLSQREASNHVSAWGPWASTGLVLFAAFIARFQHSIVRILGEMIREFGFRVKHTWHRFLRWTAGKSNNAYLKEVNSRGGPHMLSWGDRQGSNAPYPGIVRNTERHVWTEVWETFGHYIHRVSHAWEAIRKEWVEFIAFLKNPESVRERSDEAIVLEKSGTKGRKLQKQPSTAAGGAAYVGYGQPKLTDEEDANAVPLARQPRNMHESNSSGSGGIWTDSQTSAHPIDDDEAHLPPRPPPTTLHQSSFRSQRSESSPNETPAFSTLPSPYGDLAHLIHSPSELPADSLLGYSSNNLSQSLSDAITTRNTRHSAYAQELSPRPPPLSPPIPAPTQHPRRNPDHGWDANPSTSAPSTPAPMTHSTSTLLVDTGPAPAMVSPNGPPPNTPAGFSSDASTAETGHGSRAASGNRSHDVTPRSGEDDTTAGWLHVRRPASMTIRDEIRLRRDEWGVYQVIEE